MEILGGQFALFSKQDEKGIFHGPLVLQEKITCEWVKFSGVYPGVSCIYNLLNWL